MAGTSSLALTALLLASIDSLVSGTPCPPDWRQSGALCYLTNTSSTLSWAGAGALCQEHGGALVTIKSRSKLLDVVDILKGLWVPPPAVAALRRSDRVRRPVLSLRLQVDPGQDSYDSVESQQTAMPDQKWWIGIQKTSGSIGIEDRTGPFDNYGEEKIEKDASETHLCVYLSVGDGLWYWTACDNALPYICEKEADRVSVDLVTPERRRPGPAWFRAHGAALETALRTGALNSQTQADEKGEYDADRATMTPIPPSTTTAAPEPVTEPVTVPVTVPLSTAGPATTSAPPCSGHSWAAAVGHCHHLFLEARNWSMAEHFCQNKGGHLAIFDSEATQAAFRRLYGFNSGSIWIGLFRHNLVTSNVFHWVDGSQPDFFAWAQGSPSYGAAQTDDCVTLDLSTNKWITVDCSESKPFACSRAVDATERPATAATVPPTVTPAVCGGGGWWQFGSSCLLLVADTPPVSWHQAQQACLNRSATLVKITSFEQNNNIVTKLSGSVLEPVWTGLSKLAPWHVYQWPDGSNVSYTHWSGGGNNSADMASCVRLDNSHGYWSTVNCNAPHHYVCERRAGGGAPVLPPAPPPPPRSSCPADWQPYGADRCLRVFPDQTRWAEARSQCRSQASGGDLLSVASAVHQAFLTAAVKTSPNNLWISLTYATLNKRRFLTWTDESAVNYTSWAPGQPSALCNDCPDTCGAVDGRTTTTPAAWSDVDCSQAYGFVCQRPATPNNSIAVTQTFCQPTSAQYIAAGDACYKIVHDEKTWHGAADTCQSDGSGLAYVGDVFDNAELVKLLYRDGRDQYWLGLSDTVRHGIMEWTKPWPATAAFLNWDPDYTPQPTRDSCAVFVPASGRWQHRPCSTERRPFVCLRAPEREAAASTAGGCPTGTGWYGGDTHCYRVFEPAGAGVNWTEAKAACEQQGHQLATVSSVVDFRATRQAVQSLTTQFSAWVGLKSQQDKGYVWADGSSVTYRAWYRSEPTLDTGCGLASRLTNGQWQAAGCGLRKAYICMTGMDGAVGTAAISDNSSGGGGWGVFGVVILVLALTLALAGVGLWFARRQRASWLPMWLLGPRATHHSVENLAYNHRHNALSSDRAEGDTLENGGLDAIAANRWGSQEQLVIHEDL